MFRPWAKALWALLLGAGFGGAQQPAVFRSDVKLVHVIATVKNRAGDPVGTLGKDDFEIYDNGAKQEIAFLQHTTEQPLSIALLVDVSGSTSIVLKFELECASRFLRALLADGNAQYASIARLREALTEAREHIADATPEETRAKINAALQAAPVTSGQVGGWPAAPAQPKPTRPRSGSPIASTGLSGAGPPRRSRP